MEYGIISPIKIKVELIIIFKILLQCFFFLIVYSQAPNSYERPICHHANKTLNWKLKLNWERGGLKKEDVRERSRIFKHRCVVVGGHWSTFISPPIRRERLQAEPESLWGALARSLSLSLSPSVCHQMSLLVFLLVHSQRLIDIPKPFAPNAPNTKALHDTSALSAHEQQKADRHRKRPPVRERERELFQKKQSSPLWFVLRVQGTEKSIREATETRREREDDEKKKRRRGRKRQRGRDRRN